MINTISQQIIITVQKYNYIQQIKMQISKSSTTSITSHIYNHINIPSTDILKCSTCQNQQTEKVLQAQQGPGYFRIPNRHVEVFVCNFCKKLDQPKCIHCWQSKPCCTHKERVQYKEYFSSVKKEILNNYTSIASTFNTYQLQSTEQFVFSTNIKQQLMMTLEYVQVQLKKQIESRIAQNHKKLQEVYKDFQNELLSKLNPYTSDGIQRYRSQTGDRKAIRSMSLTDCVKFLKEMEDFRTVIQQQSYQLCDKYMENISQVYPQILYNKLNPAFKQILTPKVSFKSALVQTIETQDNIKMQSAQVTEEKVGSKKKIESSLSQAEKLSKELAEIIQKNKKDMKSMSQKILDLQQALKEQQEKNKKLQQVVKNVVKKLHDNDIESRKQKANLSLADPTKSTQKEQNQLVIDSTTKQQSEIKQQQAKTNKVRKQSQGKKPNYDKGRDRSSSWLQDVVKEMKD